MHQNLIVIHQNLIIMSKPVLIISDERAVLLLTNLLDISFGSSAFSLISRMPIEVVRNLLALLLDRLSKPVSHETDRA